MAIEPQGTVAPGFEHVRDVFAANFAREDEYRELGAAFAVLHRGEVLIDLWGGHRDAEHNVPWTRETLVNVWSTTKGIAAIAVALLVERGQLRYDAPVRDYWPEFGCNGKEAITVSQVLSHQAGLPGFDAPITLEEFFDWDLAAARLAAQTPMWAPGTKNSYHAMTYGFLAGELVRRASGQRIGEFVRTALAEPLHADLFIGLPEAEEHRLALTVPNPRELELPTTDIPPEAMVSITNPAMEPTLPHRRDWRAAEIPAGNGHCSAIGIARLYGMLGNGGELDGNRYLSAATIAALDTVQTDRVDIQIGIAPYWRNGLSGNPNGMYGPGAGAIGHSGWGGSFGCADAAQRLGMGYVCNQMGHEALGDPRAVALANAVYHCLDQ
ncbi:MAG: serine hydrolase domain-containing protein [Pseudomonadota bacterium]